MNIETLFKCTTHHLFQWYRQHSRVSQWAVHWRAAQRSRFEICGRKYFKSIFIGSSTRALILFPSEARLRNLHEPALARGCHIWGLWICACPGPVLTRNSTVSTSTGRSRCLRGGHLTGVNMARTWTPGLWPPAGRRPGRPYAHYAFYVNYAHPLHYYAHPPHYWCKSQNYTNYARAPG